MNNKLVKFDEHPKVIEKYGPMLEKRSWFELLFKHKTDNQLLKAVWIKFRKEIINRTFFKTLGFWVMIYAICFVVIMAFISITIGDRPTSHSDYVTIIKIVVYVPAFAIAVIGFVCSILTDTVRFK